MKSPDPRSRFRNRLFHVPVAMVCGVLLLPPLEIIRLQQWTDRNKNLKDKALADAVEKQN